MFTDQSEFDVRCEWGAEGVMALAACRTFIIVDVLSFSTCVAVAAGNGVEVFPSRSIRVENIGQGIGTHLLNLAKAHSSGSLWLYTFARNARARRFYEGHGFIEGDHGFESMWRLEDVKYRWSRTP